MASTVEPGYSATVSLELHVDDEVLSVAKVGPDRIMLSKPQAVRVGAAKLFITIGGVVEEHSIMLHRSDATHGFVWYF